MTAQSGLGFSGIVAIQIPDNGAPGTVLTKITGDNYDYDWVPGGGGGGGQVDSVVGGVNITVNAADPVNPIVNLDAAITGVSVNGVTLSNVGLATNFLNEAGAYVAVPPGGGQVDSVVGGTNISVNAGDPINPIVNLDAAITGVSVNGVTLNAVGVATNFLNETGAYSVPPVDTVTADAIYLRLDTTNNPLTGDLEFNTGGSATIYNSFLDGDIRFEVNNSSGGVNNLAMLITSEDLSQGESAVDLRPSDTCYLSNFIFMQTSLEIVNTESAFGSSVQFRLDNVAPLTAIRQFGVTTTDPGFGSITLALGGPALPNSMLFQGAFDALFSVAAGQTFEFDGPMLLTDTLSLTHQNNILLNDTFTTGGGFNGGGIRSTGTITYNNSFFIWGLMVEQKTYRALANPGFAAFTLFNALPIIENAGNFNLVTALTLNVGINHRRTTSGTSTTVGTTGMNFSPSCSAAVSGAVLTKTGGDTAIRCSPVFSTVAGSTVNHGTIRGMHFFQPTNAIFQPGAGTENMTAYLGLDFPNMTFGGVNRVIEVVRSALNVGTNIRFLNHTGTAESQFGGHIHLDDLVTLKLGGTNAVFDAGVLWLPANNALTLSGGRTRVQGAMEYPPINPAALAAGNTNDWAGLLTNAVNPLMRHWARISGNVVTSVLTGISATVAEDGDTFELTNVAANAIDIAHQDVASVAANRIISPTGVTYVLAADETVRIRYDSTTARWRLLGGTGA